MDLEGKVAIVTGGAVRLGRELALALAARGVRLAIHYHSSAGPSEETLAHIESAGGQAFLVRADVRDVAQLPGIVRSAVERFGRVDILVNSAAIFEPGDWNQVTSTSWEDHFAINLRAPFFLSQAFARAVGPHERGHIINIADWRAIHPGASFIPYTLTKSALVAMTQSLAQALAPSIQVNAIGPGAILPPPGQGLDYLNRLARTIPAQRAGAPADIARAMLFLLESDFVTGDLILVDGGQHLL